MILFLGTVLLGLCDYVCSHRPAALGLMCSTNCFINNA